MVRLRPLLTVALAALAVGAAPAAGAPRFSSTARAGSVTLTVSGAVVRGEIPRYTGQVLTLRSHGKTVVRRAMYGIAAESYGFKPKARLADISGDGIPDGLIDTFSGGAHCCTVATILVSRGNGRWASPFRRAWDGGYRLRDLGTSDGTYEIVATDQRFDYLFASHAESARPITIEHASPRRTLIDVAAQFPARLRADADTWIEAWNATAPPAGETADDAESRGFGARSALASALADLLRLGALDEAKSLAAQSVARGDFAHLPAPVDKIFDTDVAHQLQTMGFVSDWSVLGLPQ